MFKIFYQWMNQMICFCVISSALFHILPNKKYIKYIQVFTGLIFVLFLLFPFSYMQTNVLKNWKQNQENLLREYQSLVEEKEEEYQEMIESILSANGGETYGR